MDGMQNIADFMREGIMSGSSNGPLALADAWADYFDNRLGRVL